MKNTLIPLDMLFVDARGRIACIVEHTTPRSLALVSCSTPVSGVLEIGADLARRRGILVAARPAFREAQPGEIVLLHKRNVGFALLTAVNKAPADLGFE